MVEVGVDEDHLHAQFLEPEPARRTFEGGVAAGGRLRVGRPVDHHLGVLERILQQVVLLRYPQAVAEAPHVHGAPVPAFPAVGVVLAVGHPHEVHETVVRAEAVPDVAPHVVRAGGGEHPRGPQFPLTALDLRGHQIEGLVPAYWLVVRYPPVPTVAPAGPGRTCGAVRVEVDPLERRRNALGRVDRRLVGHGPRGQGGPAGRSEGPAPGFDPPRRPVVVVEVYREDADDLAVDHLDVDRPTRAAVRQSLYAGHEKRCPGRCLELD